MTTAQPAKKKAGHSKKRKRSKQKQPKQVEETVRRFLTGEDDPVTASVPSSPSHKVEKEEKRQKLDSPSGQTASLPGQPARLDGSGDHGGGDDDDAQEERTENDSAEVLEEEGRKESVTAGLENSHPDSHPASDVWCKPVSKRHAKHVNVTVILERANLETVRHKGKDGGVVLLNCDDHRHLLLKTGREANDARPDITHQCLLALLDSPLNKAGHLKVYVHTAKNVLIDVHSRTRLPRTIKRFSGLMCEVLEKFKVRGTSGSTPLLRVIRNPITSHLPVGARKVVCTYNTDNVVDVRHHAAQMARLVVPDPAGPPSSAAALPPSMPSDEEIERGAQPVNVVYVVGAMAHGKIAEEWADDYVCVSEYPLSAASVCSRITYAYESLLGIL